MRWFKVDWKEPLTTTLGALHANLIVARARVEYERTYGPFLGPWIST